MGTMRCLYDPTPYVPPRGIDLWLHVQIFYDHVNPATRRTIDQAAGGKLRDKNAKESWALLEDLALYDNESWNDPSDFAKLVKEISLLNVGIKRHLNVVEVTVAGYISTAGEVQRKYSKSLLLLVVKLLLLVLVTTARRVSAVRV
ncbi:hypothetical protein Tco_0382193 [Tanacetum coccineum]